MLKKLGNFKYILFLVLIVACASCASSKKQKRQFQAKRMEASKVNSTQLGRNRYYYSSGYKKKLEKSHKRVARNRYR